MSKYKVCKTCKSKNELVELMCIRCSGTVFEEYKETPKLKKLKLIIEDLPIKLENEDVVGREAKGEKLLALMTTISRRHARFLAEDNRWFVEDLNSSNGTYLKSLDNRVYKKTEIHDGEKLFLSRSVETIIKI